MKITFEYQESVGTTTRRKVVVLGDDATRMPISGFDDGAEVLVQSVQYPRATRQKHFHRGNRAWKLSWRTEREHADPEAAYLFRITHKKECQAAKGTIKIAIGNRTFSGLAIVQACHTPADSIGKSTVTNYQLVCDDLS